MLKPVGPTGAEIQIHIMETVRRRGKIITTDQSRVELIASRDKFKELRNV